MPKVYEYGIQEESGYFYVAMEYLDGENLSELITRGLLQPDRAISIAIELCRFLEKAHSFEPAIDGRHLRSLLHLRSEAPKRSHHIRPTSQGLRLRHRKGVVAEPQGHSE